MGFFSGRCRYLEIRAADGRYMMPIFWPDMFDRFFFLHLIKLSQVILSKEIHKIA